jgi:hypothetical protein
LSKGVLRAKSWIIEAKWWLVWQLDLVRGAGRRICARYIGPAADDSCTERTETSACEIVGAG